MTSGVQDIIDAIDSGDSIAIDAAFNKEMAARVSDKLESMRYSVAQNMFKTQEPEDLSAEEEVVDLEDGNEVVDVEDELDIEVQDTADTPFEEPDPSVETDEQDF